MRSIAHIKKNDAIVIIMTFIIHLSIPCLGIDECKYFNGHCYHICNDLPIGYNCSCHVGFKLANDSRACEGG